MEDVLRQRKLNGVKHIAPHFIRLSHPYFLCFCGYRLRPGSTPSRSGIAALPEWTGPVAFCLALGGLVLFFSEEFVASVNRFGLCASSVWAGTYGSRVGSVVGVIFFMEWCAIQPSFMPSLLGEPRFRLSVFPSSARFPHVCLFSSLSVCVPPVNPSLSAYCRVFRCVFLSGFYSSLLIVCLPLCPSSPLSACLLHRKTPLRSSVELRVPACVWFSYSK